MSAIIRPYGGKEPRLGEDVWLADNATLVGDIELGPRVNVWYGAVLRADVGWIRIGADTNVQDLACLHMSDGLSNTEIGESVTIGHHATIHGARIGNGALIGMGSTILDNAEIGDEALIAAGSVVPPRAVIPAGTLARGAPARVIRSLKVEERAQGRLSALHYIELAHAHRSG